MVSFTWDRTRRYEKACESHILPRRIGPLTFTRGVAVLIPISVPPRKRGVGNRLPKLMSQVSSPARVRTSVTAPDTRPNSAE